MKMIIGFLAIAAILSSQAMAAPQIGNQKKCIAQFGEGYGWLAFTLEKKEVCYRCREGHPQTLITSTVSVPYGPRGAYITQKYLHTDSIGFRGAMQLRFQKSGLSSGPNSGDWNQWFPQNIQLLVTYNSGLPLQLSLNGKLLLLDCK